MKGIVSALALAVTVAALAAVPACGNGDFDPVSKVTTVRILATHLDQPYAAPGETVNLDVLAYDGRATRAEPMKNYWIPFVCKDPIGDLYYACFAALSGGAGGAAVDGGSAASGAGALLGLLRPGVDLTPYLPSGATYAVTVPPDTVTAHPPVQGSDGPYGMVVVFNIACAGHIEAVERDSSNPQAVPLGCFDAAHNRLGPDDYVFGFTRIFAYDDRRNANPEIDAVLKVGGQVDLHDGLTVDHCTSDAKDCPEIRLDVTVPASSWEARPGVLDANGATEHEEIWASYFTTAGQFDSDDRLLYDALKGHIDDSANIFRAPKDPGEETMWIVVHDDRDGVAWVSFPLHVR